MIPDTLTRPVAQAVYDTVHPMSVFLFGSRARGDYRPDSDIDLLMVTAEVCRAQIYGEACVAAQRQIRALYGEDVGLDLVNLTRADYVKFNRARNHIAYKTRQEGILMAGNPLGEEPSRNVDNWPDIEERMLTAYSALDAMPSIVPIPTADRWLGFLGQQAIENSLKAYIAALDGTYDKNHDLSKLIARVIDCEVERAAGLPSDAWVTWLNNYAVKNRYSGAQEEIRNRREFVKDVRMIVDGIAHRVLELTGRTSFDHSASKNRPLREPPPLDLY